MLRFMNRATLTSGTLLAAALVAGCGSVTSAPAASLRTASPASVAPATSTGTPTATSAATPSGPQLDISQYGIALTLPPSLGEVDYSILGAGSMSGIDGNGTPYTELPGVILWTASLAADPACSVIEQSGLVEIIVFATDPTNLAMAGGAASYVKIGQDWFGVASEQGQQCTDLNPAEQPAAQALMQAFTTIQAT